VNITAAVDATGATRSGDEEPISRIGRVAVVAHRKKSLDGGLDELRSRLAEHHIEDLLWYEVSKSKKAVGAEKRVTASDQRVHGSRPRHHGPEAAQHDRTLWLSDSST
jgi:hypothetical protein